MLYNKYKFLIYLNFSFEDYNIRNLNRYEE